MFRRTSALAAAALFTLSACSGDDEAVDSAQTPTAPSPTDSATPEQDYECTDPLAGDPSEVEAYDLIVCTTLALADTEGYATTSVVEGTGETTLRVNSEPFTVEVDYADGTAIIANESEAWVDTGDGEWQEADVTSSDYLIAQATQIYDTYRYAQDPAYTSADIPEGTTYTVEGTEVIDGTEYTILGAEFDDGSTTSDLRIWVGSDYRQQKMTVTMTSPESDPLTVETEYIEWDAPQDIEIPE